MRTIGLHMLDLMKGTDVVKTLDILQQSQHWSKEELEAYQMKKLELLLAHASENVPFYRSPATGYRLPDNGIIERWSSLPREFGDWPVLDRAMVMEAGDDLLSDNINLKKCKVSRTGGTTGPPLRIYHDTQTRSFSLAAYYRFYEWMGIEPGMPEVELWGSTEISKPTIKQKIRNIAVDRLNNFRTFDAFSFNDQFLEGLTFKLKKFKPKLIRGYLSAIILLADYIRRNNIKGIEPFAVSSTAETLFPEYRRNIEEVFQAPLFNQYGCGECNSIAFECKEHKGMHIVSEHCMLESDENHNLIVTNLDNHSQPFIRYKNGDKGIIDNKPCSCGYATPRIIDLQGRANENIIRKDGSSVNGVFFANIFDEVGLINDHKILRFQIVQDTIGEIEIKLEVAAAPVSKDLAKLKDALTPFFSSLHISQHKKLETSPGGKFKYLVSNLKP